MSRIDKGKYFFISYRSIDQDFALKLAGDLLRLGYSVWVDRLHGILPGDEWRRSLERGVNNSAALIACLSRNYIESTWCRRELQRADSLHKPIFPVLLGPIPDMLWPMEIQDKQYVDFQHWTVDEAYRKGINTLLTGIPTHLHLEPGQPIEPPQPDRPDPARNDPEDLAERRIADVERLRAEGGFAAIEAEELRKDMEVWMRMYQAAAKQNRMIIDDALRVKLELQMESYRAEWENLERKLKNIER